MFTTRLQEAFIFTFIIGLCSLLPPGFREMLERLWGTGNVCRSRACRQAAKIILHNMDESVHPCKNFYDFACGNFMKTAVIQEDKSKYTTFTEMHMIVDNQLHTILSSKSWRKEAKPYKTLKKIYSLCMDEATIEAQGMAPAAEIIRKAGGWPVLERHWSGEDFSIEETETKLKSLLHSNPIFLDVGMDINPNPNQYSKHSKFTVAVAQPDLGIDREYLVQGYDNSVVQAYYKYMVDIAVLFGAEVQVARDKLQLALLFNIELAKITATEHDRKQQVMSNKHYSLEEMKMMWEYMDWVKLIQGILPPNGPLMDQGFLIRDPQYLTGLGHLIKQAPKETVANYMIWRAVQGLVPYLTSDALNSKFELDKVLKGVKMRVTRRKTCIDMCAEKLPLALSSLYARKFFSNSTRQKTQEMVKQIRQQMLIAVETATWMTEGPKTTGKIKASHVIEVIGHPEEVLDEKKVESYYTDLSMGSSNLLEVILDIKKFESDKSMIMQPLWETADPAFIINAFYNPLSNRIVLPAAILQPTAFNPNVPWYLNYGAIGTMIGHEITHGFDHVGHMFGPWGTLYDWWDEESKNNFNKQKQCMIDQYSSFKDTKVTLQNVNGVTTQGENIADNGGLKLSYRAYKKHIQHDEQRLPGLEKYSPDQMFFISTANTWCTKETEEYMWTLIQTDVHSPSEFRTNGMMMNSPRFSDVFQCKSEDEMNPKQKCSVW